MTGHAKPLRWRVVRQASSGTDLEVCSHRFRWVAAWCAGGRTRRERAGVFFDVRQAAAS